MGRLLIALAVASAIAVEPAGRLLAPAAGNVSQAPLGESWAVDWRYVPLVEFYGTKEMTGIAVQNLDLSLPATVVADFYYQKGSVAIPITINNVLPGTARVIYLPSETQLQFGRYAAIIQSDRRIAAITRTDWLRDGGAAMYSAAVPSSDVLVPLVVKDHHGATSSITIQNTDASATINVLAAITAAGATEAVATVGKSISRGTSATLDLGADEGLSAIPSGFVGFARIASWTPVAVQSFVTIPPRNGEQRRVVYGFEGIPMESAADTLYVPLFRRAYYGNTGIAVMNPGTSSVSVTLTYYGSLGTCAGQAALVHGGGPVEIAARSTAVFYQDGVVPGQTPDPGLPRGCAGSAVIEATEGEVMAIVNDALTAADGTIVSSAAYNAVSAAQGAQRIALPLYRNGHLEARLTTGIQVMNLASVTAEVALTVRDLYGDPVSCPRDACVRNVPPQASITWYPPSVPGLSDHRDMYGSAIIESDQPVAAIVNDYSETGELDAAIYNGIPADVP